MKQVRFLHRGLFGCFLLCAVLKGWSQTPEINYRRSSLHLVLIQSETLPGQEAVIQSWNSYPFPDKYNNHAVPDMAMNPYRYEVTDEERNTFLGRTETKAAAFLREYVEASSGGLVNTENVDMTIRIGKYIEESKLAHQLVAKWFNQAPNGSFDMKLIQERGFYNASDLDIKRAAEQARGLAALGDAGEALINNTFVVFSQLQFVPNEPAARAIYLQAEAEANALVLPILQEKALKAAQAVYERTKEGYLVWTKSWLFKLRWNEEIANTFYSELWKDPEAFKNTTLFAMDFVGRDEATTLVTFSFKEKRSEEKVIDISTVRNIDRVLAKLQKTHDVFKPVVPVLTNEPISAKIGMKEGLEGGEPFEVLELYQDPITGFQKYRVVGRVVAEKGKIWDNRYSAGALPEEEDSDAATPTTLDRTYFTGMKRIQPGMLLRQIR